MHTNAFEPSPSALIPDIWIESVRRTCRLTVTGFLLFGLVTALSGCAVSTTKDLDIVPSSDTDPESIIGESRGSFLRKFNLPNAQFVNDSDGTTFFVYERFTSQETTLYWPIILLAALGGGRGGGSGSNYSNPTYEVREYFCVLLRFGPDEQLVDYSVRNRSEDDRCTDEFASELAGTGKLPIDVLLTIHYGDRQAAFEMARRREDPKFIRTLAEQGDTEAATELARMFEEPGPLRKLAAQGDRKAATELARLFEEPGPLRKLADQGDREAAKELAKLTGESTEALRELAESGDLTAATLLARHADELGPLKYLAENGNYLAAHTLADVFDDDSYLVELGKEGDYVVAYERYARKWRGSGTVLTAWRWFCLAANAGYSKAQAKIGFWHQQNTWAVLDQKTRSQLEEVGVRPDNQFAYVWFAMARTNGAAATQLPYAGWGASVLTMEEITQAEQMARDWEPGDCPSPEHRLGASWYGAE